MRMGSAVRISTIWSKKTASLLARRTVASIPRRGASTASGEGPITSWVSAGPVISVMLARVPVAVLPRVPFAMTVAGVFLGGVVFPARIIPPVRTTVRRGITAHKGASW